MTLQQAVIELLFIFVPILILRWLDATTGKGGS